MPIAVKKQLRMSMACTYDGVVHLCNGHPHPPARSSQSPTSGSPPLPTKSLLRHSRPALHLTSGSSMYRCTQPQSVLGSAQ